MKYLNTNIGSFGAFNEIKILSDRYLCDGVEYQFNIVGQATIEDVRNEPTPPTPPLPTVADYTAAVQAHLDETARTRGYAGILSGVSYADDENATFSGEGQAMKTWRSACWLHCRQVLADVQAGGDQPTIAELIDDLPEIVWP
jgi:hypothetical protein